MKIRTEDALKIIQKYGSDEVPIIYLGDIYVNTNNGVLQFSQGMKFEENHYEMFSRAKILEFEAIFTEKLLAKLITNFPDRYRYPLGRKNIIDIDRLVSELEDVNRINKHKRYLISCNEVYKKNANGLYETIVHYGERLTVSRWNEVKSKLSRNSEIDFRYEECGIIVYVILKAGDSQYATRFMKFTEVVSLIVEHKKEFNVTISPDFNPDSDVYPVTEANQLYQTYVDKKPRLVILADELTDEYKPALSQIKGYDKYARLMVVKNPDPAKKRDILMMIKKVYNQDLWVNE